MRIVSFGYNTNQINQNCKNRQQNQPAFKGELYIIGNPKKVPDLPQIVIGIVQEIEKRTFQGISEITKRVKNGTSIAIVPISPIFDTFGIQLADSLSEESMVKCIPVQYIFKPGAKLIN